MPTPSGPCPDPKDDYLIALAQDAHVDYIVTGDKHLDVVRRPPVLQASGFLDFFRTPDDPNE